MRLPSLYPKQRAAFYDKARISVCEASTKSGKTVGGLTWLIDMAAKIGKPGRHFWWVEPTIPMARELGYDRLCEMFRRADPQHRTWTSNDTMLRVILANGAQIWFKGTERPDNLYGRDVWAVVMDEGSRAKEGWWPALRSTLTATRGPVRIIGNVRGRKNEAYRLARKAEAGEPDMAFHLITADDAVKAGIFPQSELDSAQSELPDAIFRELFYCEPADDGGNPFGLDAIRRCIRDGVAEGPVVAWGFDLAKKRNWTVGIGLNEHGDVAGFQRWQSDWRNTIARVKAMIGSTPALIDATATQDSIVEEVQVDCPAAEGFVFTAPSKQRLMEGLAMGIQRAEIGYPDGPIVTELESFEYEYTPRGVRYQAPEGSHDDCVDALALAYECKRTRAVGLCVHVLDTAGIDDDDDDEWWS